MYLVQVKYQSSFEIQREIAYTDNIITKKPFHANQVEGPLWKNN